MGIIRGNTVLGGSFIKYHCDPSDDWLLGKGIIIGAKDEESVVAWGGGGGG